MTLMNVQHEFRYACQKNDIHALKELLAMGAEVFDAEEAFYEALENEKLEVARFLIQNGLDPNFYLYWLPESVWWEVEEFHYLGMSKDPYFPSVEMTRFFIDMGSEINAWNFAHKTALDYANDPKLPHREAGTHLLARGGKPFNDLTHDEKLFAADFYCVFSNFELDEVKRYVNYKQSKGHRILPIHVTQAVRGLFLSDLRVILPPHQPDKERLEFLAQCLKPETHITYDLSWIIKDEKFQPFLKTYLNNVLSLFAIHGFEFNEIYENQTSLDLVRAAGFTEFSDLIRDHGGKTFDELQAAGRLKERAHPMLYLSKWELLPE